MPPRLAHKKSRAGCQRCKARKVKCDEIRPICSNCARHHVDCQYPTSTAKAPRVSQGLANIPTSIEEPSAHQETTSDASSTPFTVQGPDSPYSDFEGIEFFNPEERRNLELRLLYHYVTNVAHTFPSSDEKHLKPVYTVQAIELGFRYSFLLDAIFAVAALHAYTIKSQEDLSLAFSKHDPIFNPPYNLDYAKAHRIYLNRAVHQQRNAIMDINSENADAVFLTSILLAMVAFRLLPSSSSTSAYTAPVQWLSMSNALSPIVQASRPYLQSNAVITMIINNAQPDFRNHVVIFNPANTLPFRALLDWAQFPEPEFTSEVVSAYERVLAYIGGILKAIERNDPSPHIARRIFSFGSLVPRLFVDLVAKGRPRALVILAHHFAMCKAVDRTWWWFDSVAEKEILGIQTAIPDEWQWALEWPLKVLREELVTG